MNTTPERVNIQEQSRVRLLIIDDDEMVGQTLVEMLLSEEVYDITLAARGAEGLDHIREKEVDLVLSDITMPGMSGVEVLQACAAIDPLLPVIMMTGNADGDELEIQCLREGARYFLRKPIHYHKLLATVGAVNEHASHIREQRLQLKRLQELLDEKEMFMQAYEHFPHAAILTGLDGKIQYINEAFASLYGYTREEALGQTPSVLNPGREEYHQRGTDDEAYDQLFKDMWKAITDPTIGFWEGDVSNKTKDGQILSVHLIINAIRDTHGQPIGFMGLPVNITERQKLERGVRIDCYQALSALAEKRDNETGEHLVRMSEYARIMAEALELPKHTVSDLALFAPLHDIGKVGIADAILLAPRKLTDEEFARMREHTRIGHAIIAERPTFGLAAEMTRSHHERWDGAGYPDGLTGEDIPLSARLLAVCDVYDACRSKRPYKEPFPHEVCAEIIENGAGKHFDPAMVRTFQTLSDRFADIFDSHA